MSPARGGAPARGADGDRATLERELTELANLYEIARQLLGASDARRVASRAALAAMGSLGARSAAVLLAAGRGRLRAACVHGAEDAAADLAPLRLDAAAAEWALARGAFRIAGARAAAPLREALAGRFEASAGAALPGAGGLAGLLLVGPRLMEEPYDDDDLARLGAIAGLAARALEACPPAGAGDDDAPGPAAPRAGARDEPGAAGGGGRAARALDALRRAHPPLAAMAGSSPALLDACEDLLAVAATRYPVLITGESGVGKELAARAVHELSDRAAGPFEVVDCGAIPRHLIESELFGHVRGAFTGAERDRRGAFQLAHRGTLFLDEIGEMPLQLQTRLLRVLQEGRFRRVGDERALEADVRVVAATNRDLRGEVEAGRFRQDLFYRLNVFAVRLPPLRERAGDVPLLARRFLAAAGGRALALEPAAAAALERHAWPGNVRELANLCATLAVRGRARGRVALDDLDEAWRRLHGTEPPWRDAGPPRDRLGAWVLEQARAARFNLVEAERRLHRAKRAGARPPMAERSALSYWLAGETLRALAAAGGDAERAARALAGDDEDLLPRARARVERALGALRAARDLAAARRAFARVPPEYDADLAGAFARR